MKPAGPRERIVALILFEGFQSLDVFGPLDAFDAANSLVPGSYRLQLWSLEGEEVRAENGARVLADRCVHANLRPDTLIIPGGYSARTLQLNGLQRKLLVGPVRRGRRLVSVCTGASLAAELTEGSHRIATHWKYADELRTARPFSVIAGRFRAPFPLQTQRYGFARKYAGCDFCGRASRVPSDESFI